ncbi:MAG: hypothetical protein ACI9JT_001754 [Polaribacter sp.]|jgi:hypothetical protein
MCTYLKLNILFLFLVSNICAQEVRLIDNKGTIKKVRNTRVTTSNNAPPEPIEGDVWINTSTSVIKIYDANNALFVTISSPAVYTGSFIIPAPDGNNDTNFTQTITNLPFLPSQITFVAYTNIESFPTSNDNQASRNSNTIQNTAGSMNGFVRNDGTANFLQQVIFIAAHGNSINDISRYASNTHCLGLRYTNQNGQNLGIINAALTSFDTNGPSFGFTLDVNYIKGTGNNDIFDENLIVFYTAHK